MLSISETLIIGFDLYKEGKPTDVALSVAKCDGVKMKYLNTLTGKEALEAYAKLTNNKEEM